MAHGEQDPALELATTLRTGMARMPERVGGYLCLDFANTVEPRGTPSAYPPPDGVQRDYLGGYTDLIAWARYAQILDEQVALDLLARAAACPAAAERVLARAAVLREAIYRIFRTLAEAGTPDANDLERVAEEYAVAAAHAALTPSGLVFAWSWAGHEAEPDRPLWPLAWSTAALLTAVDLRRVKVCPGTPNAVVPCAWLFYDATKNRIRHWCSMADCGTKTKVQRQTGRRRAARALDRRMMRTRDGSAT